MSIAQPLRAPITGAGGIAHAEIIADDPFWRSMDGGAVPWHPIKSTRPIKTSTKEIVR